jgi:hypothetical protein
MNIVFTNIFDVEIEPPKPASKLVHDWYKNTESYVGNKKTIDKGEINGYIRCNRK